MNKHRIGLYMYLEAPPDWTCSPDVAEVWESSEGGLQPTLKLRRQRVKGTPPLVYSDSYHSLSFVCQC